MTAVFAGQPLASALLSVTALVWVALELVQSLRRRADAVSGDRWSLAVLRVCITAGMLLAAFALRVKAAAIPAGVAVSAAALLLMWCGIGLRWWCFRTLGRYFTFAVMTSADQPVVASGPYRVVRHPSYTGMLVALCGVGLLFGNWLSFAAAVVLPCVGMLYRIHVEESALASSLGTRYSSYASTRKRLIPLVW